MLLKSTMKNLFVCILFINLLFYCQILLNAQSETSGRESIYRASHTKMTELKHTKLRVNFDYGKEQMQGEEWLTASPYFYSTDSLVLNAKAMLIHEVSMIDDQNKKTLDFNYENDILHINLGKVYKKDEDYTVYIKYTARPNDVKSAGSIAINDNKGLYFINPRGEKSDEPTQIWTQGETESSSVWFPTIDKTNQKTTQEIYITVPEKYITLSNGILKDSKKESENMRTDHWVMDKKHSPYLFFMGIGEYSVIRDEWKNIPVEYYLEKEYEPYAHQIYGSTPEMMDFFSKYLNYNYPWAKYAQMSARDYVSGAMENTTATLHSDAVQQSLGQLVDENKWESTIAHELFHHWFGDLVTAESWSNLTINESFANYSEYLWFEYKYGRDMADYHQMVGIEHYLQSSDYEKDLVRFDYNDKEDMFDLVSYQKGGAILHMLRNYLGDEAFRAGLNDFLKTHEYSVAEAHDLRLSLEKISGRDLNWFFNQWFFSSGHPKLSYTYSYEPVKKQVELKIIQSGEILFQFPLAIDVYINSNPVRHNVWIDAKSSNTFSFPSEKSPNFININSDGVLLSEITDNNTPEQYFLQYKKSKEFINRYKAVENAIENVNKNNNSLKTLILALEDPFFRIRIKALRGLDLSNKSHAKFGLSKVLEMASNDPKTLVRGEAISVLGKTKDKKYLSLYEDGLKSISNSIKINSLIALSYIDTQKAVNYIDKIDLKDVDRGLLKALLPIIVKNKKLNHLSAVANIVALYPFTKFDDSENMKSAKEAFNLIMNSDDLKASENITRTLNRFKSRVDVNFQAKNIVIEILKYGLEIKRNLFKKYPQNHNLYKQIELINKTINGYSD